GLVRNGLSKLEPLRRLPQGRRHRGSLDGCPRTGARWTAAGSAAGPAAGRARVLGRGRPAAAHALESGGGGHRAPAAAAAARAQRAVPGGRMRGLVSLVGAGPGDPDLLTLRAVDRLRAADLILYDALVDRAALRHAPHARWAYVGKRAGRHSISQETIERIMIRRALAGERVVRLKSGDPFVFGRGGEEALALAAAGVPCEVVPGVSAAVAGPALSGIPVTHRGTVSAFLVVSGHAEAAFAPALGSLAPGAATVVVLMGISTRAGIAALLISRGWDSHPTP